MNEKNAFEQDEDKSLKELMEELEEVEVEHPIAKAHRLAQEHTEEGWERRLLVLLGKKKIRVLADIFEAVTAINNGAVERVIPGFPSEYDAGIYRMRIYRYLPKLLGMVHLTECPPQAVLGINALEIRIKRDINGWNLVLCCRGNCSPVEFERRFYLKVFERNMKGG